MHRLEPQSGGAFRLNAGDSLEIIDIEGEQVADLALFSSADLRERFSAGRTLDYTQRIYLRTGDALHSNRSRAMMAIEHDDVGRHDYLLTPCSARMFELLWDAPGHPSCLSNLAAALAPYGLAEDDLNATLNVFMNVAVDQSGAISVQPPRSRPGSRVLLRALMDVTVGLTSCSSEHTNNGRCKPIGFRIGRLI